MTSCTDEVRAAMAPFVGLSYRETSRAAEMQKFYFGSDVDLVHQRRGRTQTRPRFAIHVQCAWRIVDAGQVVVASWDHDPEPAAPGEPWEYRSTRLRAFLGTTDRSIRSAHVTDVCDLNVEFSDGSALEIFRDISQPDRECYRVIDVLGDHVVVIGTGTVDVVGPPAPDAGWVQAQPVE